MCQRGRLGIGGGGRLGNVSKPLTAASFLSELSSLLGVRRSELASNWREKRSRTAALKGSGAQRGGSPLAEVFERHGFRHNKMNSKQDARVYAFEWFGKDLVAVDGLGESWDRACWLGRYRVDAVVELENDLREFDLTMRGLLDVRARLYVGIFFAETADPLIGEALWAGESRPSRRISQWSPTVDAAQFSDGEELLAVVLSGGEPVLLGSYAWQFSRRGWSPIGPGPSP